MHKLYHCGNTHDPRLPNYERYIIKDYQASEENVSNHNQWLRARVIGKPQWTAAYSTYELINGKVFGELPIQYNDWIMGWCDTEEEWIEL